MRLSQPLRRRSAGPRISRAVRKTFEIDALESRRMMDTETVQTSIPPVLANVASPTENSVTLNKYFTNSTLPGTLATFNTSEGEIQVALTDAATPLTVANFLSYVNSGEYDDTFFHRSVDLDTGNGGTPDAPATIIQGGGYSIMNNSIGHIATTTPVNDEYTSEVLQDVQGTLAMAKTSAANSATSEWYFNVTDNTELDVPTMDPTTMAPTSYTVFGTVLSGMQVIDTIAALPTASLGSGLTNVPVVGLTEAEVAAQNPVGESNLVFTYDITTEAGTSYTVSSDNAALVKPTVTNGVLSFTYGSGFGTANITVNADNLDGDSASTVVSVTVPNSATPTAGPVTAPFTAPYTVTGSTGTFSVLGPDTDSEAALLPSSVTITVPPVNGTATVNTSNGFITYSPNAGYTGPDSLSYTVADENGSVSAPAVVTLDAVPTAVKQTLKPGQVLVVELPDGITSHVVTGGASAVVTFTDFQVTIKNKGSYLLATGEGTAITDITLTNTVAFASLGITANGPLTVGGINDVGSMSRITAPTTTLTGNTSIGFISQFSVAALNGASLVLGGAPNTYLESLTIPTVTNSDFNCSGNVGTVRSKQWVVTDNETHYFIGGTINNLQITGDFENDLDMTYPGFFQTANVGSPTGAWTVDGSILRATFGTPGTNWSMQDYGEIKSLRFTGNLANSITADTIGTMSVQGTTNGAVVECDGAYNKKFEQIGSIAFAKAVSNTVVYSNGSIGSITAPSLTGSRIYAGVILTVAQNTALAISSADIANDAAIRSITLGRGAAAFSNSLISADAIDSLHLGKVTSANGGTAQGVSAHTIGAIAATLVPGGTINAGPAQLKTAAKLTAYETKAKVTLGDFEINLF